MREVSKILVRFSGYDVARSGIAALLAACLFVSCAESSKLKPAAKAQKAAQDDDDDDDDVDLNDIQTDTTSIEDLIKKCGVDSKKLADPNAVLFQKDIKSYPMVFAGSQIAVLVNVVYKVEITSILKIKSTPASGRMETDFIVKAEPSLAEGPANDTVAPMKGVTTTKGYTLEERTKALAEASDWTGIMCSIQPTASAEVVRGAGTVKVAYKPALPGSISPLGVAEIYGEEIGSGKTFSDIEAEVTQSNNMDVSAGKYKGSITVKRVQPTLVLNAGGKAGAQVNADAAYKFVADGFGGPKAMSAMGIMPEVTYYIDHKKKDFVAIVAKTGDSTVENVVFLSEMK